MSRIISSFFVALSFATAAGFAYSTPEAEAHGCENGCGGGGWGGLGVDLDLGLDLDIDVGLDLDLGKCFDIDVDLGADCAIVADVDAGLYCDPLSVEAACIAELGVDCGLDAFLGCVADMTAHCEAEVEAGGALFCDGVFLGADACLGGLEGLLGGLVDIDLDIDACFDVDLGVDVDLDVDICLDVGLGVDVDCAVAVGAECLAKCDPIAVEAACLVELGEDCSLHEMAACQAGLMAHCQAACNLGGALFCDADVYAGFFFCE